MSKMFESGVEEAALDWLRSDGFVVAQGSDIAADGRAAERADLDCRDVVLEGSSKKGTCSSQSEFAVRGAE